MSKHSKAVLAAAAACVLAAWSGSAFAGVVSVSTPSGLTNNGQVDWGVLGAYSPGGATYVANPSSISSVTASGVGISVSQTATTSDARFVRIDESDQANGIAGWGGNFAPREKLLWTNYNAGVMTIVFSSLVRGVGAKIQQDGLGAFDGTIQAFDVNGNSLGVFTRTDGNPTTHDNHLADDTAIFLGLLSDTANIKSVTFRTNLHATETATGFAISGPIIQTATPPISTVPLPPAVAMGAGLLGAMALARLRRRRQSPG